MVDQYRPLGPIEPLPPIGQDTDIDGLLLYIERLQNRLDLLRGQVNGSVYPQLRKLESEIDAVSSGAVSSVFTRTGAVVAAASDYDASQIDNDSGVSGSFVDDALDALYAMFGGINRAAENFNLTGTAGGNPTSDGNMTVDNTNPNSVVTIRINKNNASGDAITWLADIEKNDAIYVRDTVTSDAWLYESTALVQDQTTHWEIAVAARRDYDTISSWNTARAHLVEYAGRYH